MIARLLCALGWHQHTYREYRTLYGFDVLYLVCDHCDHAEPAIMRSPDEYRQFTARSPKAPKAKKEISESVRPFRRAQ